MKKGQGLSISTIVVAAIALLVLVVLVAFFTGQMSTTSKSMKDCENVLHGTCELNKSNCKISDGKTIYPGKTDCGKDNKICCISLDGSD